jgi:hypothetical protein
MSLHVERGPMIIDDVRALPQNPLVVAEGTTLPARLVPAERALWLLPTPEVRRQRLDERGLPGAARALYELLAERIEAEAAEAGVPVLPVDGSLGIDETLERVGRRFAAVLPPPEATSRAERKALLREANLDVVRQVRGYFARPWAEGSAGDVVRSFACECGALRCVARVAATVATVADAPVVEPGHER